MKPLIPVYIAIATVTIVLIILQNKNKEPVTPEQRKRLKWMLIFGVLTFIAGIIAFILLK